MVKNPLAIQDTEEMWVWSLGQEDPLEEGMATHSSVLAWRIPWTEEPGGLQYVRLQRVRHSWVTKHTQRKGNRLFKVWGGFGAWISVWDVWIYLLISLTNGPLIHQFSSATQSCLTLWHPMDCSTPGLPVHRRLPKLTQTHVHWVGDVIQPFHHLLSPSPLAFNLSQHQGLFQWVSSSHQVAKVLEFYFSISPSNEYSGLISFRMAGWISL